MEYHYTNHTFQLPTRAFFPLKDKPVILLFILYQSRKQFEKAFVLEKIQHPVSQEADPWGPMGSYRLPVWPSLSPILLLQFGVKSDIRLIQVPD